MLPVVLHHGLCGFSNVGVGKFRVRYFPRIDRALQARGHPLIVTGVHPTAGVETRARQLKDVILRQLDIQNQTRKKVIIIAHSMGGLDARYMIHRLGMEDRVAALLTITTPHRGSPYADWCAQNLGRRMGGFRLMSALRLDVGAIADLTTQSCQRFNQQVPDSERVKYFSISAARPWHRVPPFALHSWKIIHEAEGDNDALVSVRSSTWGTHLGVWPADHWHTINHRMVIELKEPTGDITPLYMEAMDKVLSALGRTYDDCM